MRAHDLRTHSESHKQGADKGLARFGFTSEGYQFTARIAGLVAPTKEEVVLGNCRIGRDTTSEDFFISECHNQCFLFSSAKVVKLSVLTLKVCV